MTQPRSCGTDHAIERTAGVRKGTIHTPMPTKLEKTIRREIEIDGEPFTISISPEGFRLTKKRFRSGVALSWKALWARHGGRPVGVAEVPEDR
jgi:hypothetical protein